MIWGKSQHQQPSALQINLSEHLGQIFIVVITSVSIKIFRLNKAKNNNKVVTLDVNF